MTRPLTRADDDATRGWTRSVGRRGRYAALVALAVLAVLVNLGVRGRAGRGREHGGAERAGRAEPRVTLAAPLDEQRVLVATLGNEVLRLEGGRPAASAAFSNVVGGLAASAGRDEVYVGRATGQSRCWTRTCVRAARSRSRGGWSA